MARTRQWKSKGETRTKRGNGKAERNNGKGKLGAMRGEDTDILRQKQWKARIKARQSQRKDK